MRLAALVLLALLSPGPAAAQSPPCGGPIVFADFAEPTRRYRHAVLGDDEEWGALQVSCVGRRITATLPDELVFEDLAPRLVDLDNDGMSEIVVVESHRDLGARLAVWGLKDRKLDRLAATPHIGQAFRWLAPLGAADLDIDGAIELAYVDRPHLAKILRVWRYADGTLTEVAALDGVTNHRIGQDFIQGGIRDCGFGPQIVAADGEWRRVLLIRLEEGRLAAQDIGPYRGPVSLDDAMACGAR